MNLTDIMLFGKAIIGDGGSGGSAVSKKKVFYFTGNEEDVTAQYPIDETASIMMGIRLVRLSDEPLTADEMDSTFIMIASSENSGYLWTALEASVANGGIVSDTEGGVPMAAVIINNPAVISILESADIEGFTVPKGVYFNLDMFLRESADGSGKRAYVHMLIACGA